MQGQTTLTTIVLRILQTTDKPTGYLTNIAQRKQCNKTSSCRTRAILE